MFFKKKSNKNKDLLNFKSDNYKMKENYQTDNLVVANLEYISNEALSCGPMVNKTTQRYIFEMIVENGKIRYREIFTGFIADSSESNYFNLPYVVDIVPLKDQVLTIANNISKYGLLLVLNEVNENKQTKKLTK